MSDPAFIIPEEPNKQRAVHRRFPAVAQFAVLVLLLGGLLGGVVFPFFNKPTQLTPIVGYKPTTETPATAVTVTEITPSRLEARAVHVYDVVADRVLYSKNAEETLPLASIAKLMTALVAREIMTDNETLTVPTAATTQTSASGLSVGETLSLHELRDYAMLASSNDAAYTIAAEGGALLHEQSGTKAFVTAMNITAEELSLASMRFNNATGLDMSPTTAGAYGNARDVSLLMTYILRTYPDILAPTTMSYERIYNTAGAYHEAENTNPAINAIPNLLGSKTGYTDLAQGNLTIAFDAGYNRPIIITVLGSSFEGRFTDVERLTASVQEAFKKASINNES